MVATQNKEASAQFYFSQIQRYQLYYKVDEDNQDQIVNNYKGFLGVVKDELENHYASNGIDAQPTYEHLYFVCDQIKNINEIFEFLYLLKVSIFTMSLSFQYLYLFNVSIISTSQSLYHDNVSILSISLFSECPIIT